jgi:hypothetical protein
LEEKILNGQQLVAGNKAIVSQRTSREGNIELWRDLQENVLELRWHVANVKALLEQQEPRDQEFVDLVANLEYRLLDYVQVSLKR